MSCYNAETLPKWAQNPFFAKEKLKNAERLSEVIKKTVFFTVRLTVRVDHPPPLRSGCCDFFLMTSLKGSRQKKQACAYSAQALRANATQATAL